MEAEVFADKYRVTQVLRADPPVESYKGLDDTGADVAIKVVHTDNELTTRRFEQDLAAVSDLLHPNVARTLGWGPRGDGYYVVREWVAGTDLATMQRQGRMTALDAARYAAQVCTALSALHARGVVHKNVRPENLVLEPDGTVKLVDVGAPRAGVSVAAPRVGPDAVHFICPEQARGQVPVPQSDIYSLGVVLYFLSTGQVPFDADTAQAVVADHIDSQPEAPRRLNPEVPASLESVILRAMAKDPSQRYSSAEEMRQDLERVTAMPPTKRKTWPWVVVGSVLVVIVAASIWWFSATVPVPNVRGLSLGQASAALRTAGLRTGTVRYQQPAPEGVALGTVIGEAPPTHSRVRHMTAVNLVIAGPEQTDVPDLTGMTQSAATAAIRQAKLKLGGVRQAFNAKVPAGNVSRQDPPPGTQAPVGSIVTIVLSEGIRTGVVPNVVGSSQSNAITGLEAAGFKVSMGQSYSSGVPQGNVISQNPGAGTTADVGVSVSIVVSRGRQAVAVPDVVGMSQTNAANALGEAGLKVKVTYATGGTPPGQVIDQSPDAGTDVQPGSTVTIVVAKASPSPPPTGTP